jgi:hypothetical protein
MDLEGRCAGSILPSHLLNPHLLTRNRIFGTNQEFDPIWFIMEALSGPTGPRYNPPKYGAHTEPKSREMTMKRHVLFAPLALAACNSQPGVTATNASVAEVSNKVDAALDGGQFVSPGRWETRLSVAEMTMPNMPPQFAERMKSHMGQGQVHASCLSAEDVKKPKGDFFGAQKDCRYDHFKMAGGTIDAKMICASPEGTRTMSMTGNYTNDSYHMAMSSEGGDSKGPMGAMSMKMVIDAKRTGACTGTETS